MRWPLYEDPAVASRVDRLEIPFNEVGLDRWGVSKPHLTVFFSALALAYHRYFRVKCLGIDNVPPRGRAMLVGNHSGGVAVDGAMVIASCLLEMEPPRLAQGMAEKFLNRLPVSSLWTNRVGQFTGLPEHAQRLLEEDRLLMVFPEGVRGTAKLYTQRHSLTGFGTGFMRLAMATGTPIIPLAFIGGGEVMPTIRNLHGLGRVLGVPYIPLTPYLLPVPLPRACEVYYGKPMVFAGTGMEEDEAIEASVAKVKTRISSLMAAGLRRRRAGRRGAPWDEDLEVGP